MYDFDTVWPRRGTDSTKWNVKDSELPMWIADMDFKTAPEITEALTRRAENGIFGYTRNTDEWYDAYIGWWSRRHGLVMEKEGLLCCTGAVPAASCAVRHLTAPGDRVVLNTPAYNMFFNCILNNGREVSESPLIYENGAYSMDFDDLERKFADKKASMFILCNPHNPTGRIWSARELARIGELAERYDVTVVSDEVHCDITAPGKEYTPFAAASETCRKVGVCCMGPSKTFNLAGLKTGAVYVHDEQLCAKMRQALRADGFAEINAFAGTAVAAAFGMGDRWVDELRQYVFDNRAYAEDFIAREIPELSAVKAEATYLMWVDVRAAAEDSREFAAFLREKTGLYVSAGAVYGGDGVRFLRVNLACPRALVQDGMQRLKAGVEAWNARA